MDGCVDRWTDGQEGKTSLAKATFLSDSTKVRSADISHPLTQLIREEGNWRKKNGWWKETGNSIFLNITFLQPWMSHVFSKRYYRDSSQGCQLIEIKPYQTFSFRPSPDEHRGRDRRPKRGERGDKRGQILRTGPCSCATSWALGPEVVWGRGEEKGVGEGKGSGIIIRQTGERKWQWERLKADLKKETIFLKEAESERHCGSMFKDFVSSSKELQPYTGHWWIIVEISESVWWPVNRPEIAQDLYVLKWWSCCTEILQLVCHML